MACACKVIKHIDKIQEVYGSNDKTVKTNIKGTIEVFFKQLFIWIITLPFMPLILILLVVRKIFTNKPISISRFIKRRKNVRN